MILDDKALQGVEEWLHSGGFNRRWMDGERQVFDSLIATIRCKDERLSDYKDYVSHLELERIVLPNSKPS